MDEKNPEISPVPEPTPASTSAPEPSPVSGPVPEPMTAAPAADASAAAPAAPVSAGPAVAEPVSEPMAAAPAANASESVPAAAAAANPFATYHAPAPVAVTPEPTAPVAPVPVPPSAQPYAVGASEPAQPYATAAPTAAAAPAAPTVAPYGQPTATYDAPASFYAAPDPAVYSAYGTYGAPQQPGAGAPPTPPVPPAPVYGYEPPTSGGQKRRWPWFLLGLAVGLVVGMGGCASCVGVMALADYDNYDTYDYDYNYDDEYGYDHGYDYGYGDDYGSDVPGIDSDALNESPFDTYSYDELAEMFEGAGLAAGVPGEDGRCAMGFYTVGPDGDIPAGLYFTEGSNEKLSRFYVFESESKERGYELEDGVQYFGNYFVELDDGDLIVFLPGAAELTMHPAPATSFNPTAPYNNGCYRVGVDIPAGSYTITALPADEGETDDESAAYVMKDLEFNDDSIIDTQYVIPGGKQVVTVADGQYLELFAATATPVAQG